MDIETYHSQISLQSKEHHMLLQIPKLLHFSREEKSLLNRVDLISSSPLLKFFDRRVKRERGSIQYQRGAPSKDLGAPVCCSTKISSLSGTFLLLGFSNLRSFWRLLLHYGLNLALFRALLPSPLISFSFLLYRLKRKGSSWKRGRRSRVHKYRGQVFPNMTL